MACSISLFCSSNQAFCRHKLFHYPKMRAQKFKDNEKPANNIVDANMSVLRERMEQVRKKERVISTSSDHEWNYKQSYENMCKRKRDAIVSEFAETMGLACGAIGLVFLTGSLCICLLSLLFHMYIK